MFGPSYLSDITRRRERDAWRQQIASNHRIGVTRAVKGVINRRDVSEAITRIDKPTLIIVGEEDVATVPEKSERMRAAIGGSILVKVPRAGHSSTIEEPRAVNDAMSAFLNGLKG